MSLFFEESDQLVGSQNGADFNFPVNFREVETLSWLEIHGFTNLFRDDDLVFG